MKSDKTYLSRSRSGIDAKLPKIGVWKNQFRKYEIKIEYPEFNTVCPLTGLPDLGTITITYEPDKFCVEMKSLKLYFVAYRNIGIFQENAINRILEDFVRYVKPKWVEITGNFMARGGMTSKITARYPHSKGKRKTENGRR
ncbi:MAG: NADPH-dependent 7-cyano-7-deazaguanine reductase QueF [Elusimicrobia bacterium]|nr:NADPH-dependent 7-cyano-7-deazaguanine reductase QueF [Elusimicrobiota bacterium]